MDFKSSLKILGNYEVFKKQFHVYGIKENPLFCGVEVVGLFYDTDNKKQRQAARQTVLNHLPNISRDECFKMKQVYTGPKVTGLCFTWYFTPKGIIQLLGCTNNINKYTLIEFIKRIVKDLSTKTEAETNWSNEYLQIAEQFVAASKELQKTVNMIQQTFSVKGMALDEGYKFNFDYKDGKPSIDDLPF